MWTLVSLQERMYVCLMNTQLICEYIFIYFKNIKFYEHIVISQEPATMPQYIVISWKHSSSIGHRARRVLPEHSHVTEPNDANRKDTLWANPIIPGAYTQATLHIIYLQPINGESRGTMDEGQYISPSRSGSAISHINLCSFIRPVSISLWECNAGNRGSVVLYWSGDQWV